MYAEKPEDCLLFQVCIAVLLLLCVVAVQWTGRN
jgi:hypothetical protein